MRDWLTILTIITSALTVIGAVFGFFKWFKGIFDKKFAQSDAKFELLEERIFQLAMGKSLKEIMKEEKKK